MSYKVTWTEEKKEMAIAKLTKYFELYGVGECIMQDDEAIIDASSYLSDIVDDILIEGDGIEWAGDKSFY